MGGYDVFDSLFYEPKTKSGEEGIRGFSLKIYPYISKSPRKA